MMCWKTILLAPGIPLLVCHKKNLIYNSFYNRAKDVCKISNELFKCLDSRKIRSSHQKSTEKLVAPSGRRVDVKTRGV